MSAEAARMISCLRKKTPGGATLFELGTIKSVAPLMLRLDDVDFDISKGILINSSLLQHTRSGSVSGSPVSINNATITMKGDLAPGDRVAAIRMNSACTVIVCKVVSA